MKKVVRVGEESEGELTRSLGEVTERRRERGKGKLGAEDVCASVFRDDEVLKPLLKPC